MPLRGFPGLLARARASRRVGVGVALGPSSLRAVVVERAGTRLQLLAAQEASCDTSQAEPLTRALADLRQRLRVTAPVVLGVPSTSAILTTVQPLIVTPRRAALAVQFELQQHLPFELADAAWHYQWLKPPAQAVAGAMRQSLLDERLSACRRAGLNVRAVTVNGVAALNAASLLAPSRGATTSWLTLIEPQQAEWSIWGPDRLQVVPVTSPSPDALWEHVTASWQALRAEGLEAAPPVWLVGPPDSLAPAQQALGGTAVERADFTKAIGFGTVQVEQPDRMAVALGLALQGVGAAPLPLNLLDGAQRETQARLIRQASLIAAGACLAVAVLVGANGMLTVRARRVGVQRALEQRERLYQTLRPEIRALIQRQQRTEGRSLQLAQLAADSPALTRWLSQIAAAMPRAVWLTALDGSKGGGLGGLLEGRATSFQDVTKFLEQLKSQAGMTTVKPLSTNVITDETLGKEVIAFSVQVERPLQPESAP
ncbi:MAG: PilN domain-containing protein [Candidatus Omnitrophica bacterium]|nr:PilN domain-containing protein [Candidatus Omnitrophota bacterium]